MNLQHPKCLFAWGFNMAEALAGSCCCKAAPLPELCAIGGVISMKFRSFPFFPQYSIIESLQIIENLQKTHLLAIKWGVSCALSPLSA